MVIRSASIGDAAGVRNVSLAAEQPETDSGADERYLNLLLATGSVLVAEADDGEIVGWGATRDGQVGSLLSDLFVHPEHQGAGIGGAILRGLWPGLALAPRRYTFSSRHPLALPLYAKAGLVPRWPLLYLTGRWTGSADDGLSVELVPGARAAEAELQLLGEDRTPDYEFWTGAQGGSGLVVKDRQSTGGDVLCAGAVRSGELAHLVCPAEVDPAAALRAALSACDGEELALCLPGPHPAVQPLLNSGFRITEYDLAMSSRGLALPTGWVYAPGLG